MKFSQTNMLIAGLVVILVSGVLLLSAPRISTAPAFEEGTASETPVSNLPSEATPPLKESTTETVIWMNSGSDLAFTTPGDWSVRQADAGNASLISIQPPNGAGVMTVFLQLPINIADESMSFEEWREPAPDFPRATLTVLSIESGIVDGFPAIKRTEAVNGNKRIGYYLEHGGRYILIAYPSDDPLTSVFASVLRSIDLSPEPAVRQKARIIP